MGRTACTEPYNTTSHILHCTHHLKIYIILTSVTYNLYSILFYIILYYHLTENSNKQSFVFQYCGVNWNI